MRTALSIWCVLSLFVAGACSSSSSKDVDATADGPSSRVGGPGGTAIDSAVATGGTTSTGTGRICDPGLTRICVGQGACAGGQTCLTSGTWSSCDCGSAAGGAIGVGGMVAGTGGTVGTGGNVMDAGTATKDGPTVVDAPTTTVDVLGTDGRSNTGTGTDTGTYAPPLPSLSCLQILQCIADCPDADADCPDACVEKGSPEGQVNIIAYATCVDQSACTDATCAQDNCSASLDLCVTSSIPEATGTPPPAVPPPGSVPPDLVGTWSGAVNGNTGVLTLGADGSGSWKFTVTWQMYACFSFKTTTMSGNVVVSEAPRRPDGGRTFPAEYGKITLYATSVVESTRECTPGTTDTIKPAATVEILWNRDEVVPYHEVADPNIIHVLDSECVATYTAGGKDPGSALGMYCTYQLTRK